MGDNKLDATKIKNPTNFDPEKRTEILSAFLGYMEGDKAMKLIETTQTKKD